MTRNGRHHTLSWVLVTFLACSSALAVAAPGSATAATKATGCGDAWTLAPTVFTHGWGGIDATAASSASDAWVISAGFSSVGFNVPIPEHWDGSTWTVTSDGGGLYALYGIVALDPTDAWAVGWASTGYLYRDTVLITHWDGTSWTDVRSPGKLGAAPWLAGIDAVSADDIWAVGGSRGRSLIEHWDGSSWSVVPSPNAGSESVLDAVSFDAPDDGWAVGRGWRQRPSGRTFTRPLLVHWDGTMWTRMTRPRGVEMLSSVAALAPNDVWAVGSAGSNATAVHWDGDVWATVPTPSAGSSSAFASVAATGTADVWAVGSQRSGPGAALRTLVERWDGSMWRSDPSPNVGPKDNALYAVSAVQGLILAGGSAEGKPLALQRCPA